MFGLPSFLHSFFFFFISFFSFQLGKDIAFGTCIYIVSIMYIVMYKEEKGAMDRQGITEDVFGEI